MGNPTRGLGQAKSAIAFGEKSENRSPVAYPASLLNFYNAHLANRDSLKYGYVEDRFGSALHAPGGPTFLIDGTPWWHEVFPKLNIYSDGILRTVIIHDYDFIHAEEETLQSQLLVLNPGMPDQFVAGEAPYYIDESNPALELWVDFDHGGIVSLRPFPQSLITTCYGNILASRQCSKNLKENVRC